MGEKMTLEQVREHLRAVTVSHGFTTNYDAWNEARKALAYEILAMLSVTATSAQAVDVGAIREVIADLKSFPASDRSVRLSNALTRAIGNAQAEGK